MLNTRKITVSVTDKHMQEGVKSNCYGCPIAIAVCEAMGLPLQDTTGEQPPLFTVSLGAVTFYEVGELGAWGKQPFVAELPESARLFVKYFDQGFHSLAPFSFELEVPESLIRG